jgi:hypothetical protein
VAGQPVKVTQTDSTNYLGFSNAEPVRIGGHHMEWSPPSAWFNSSLDGEMTDWRIEVS